MEKVKLIVVGALFFENEKFWMFRRNQPGPENGLLEFPGGKVETGETLEQALIREIREELGLDIEVLQKMANVVVDKGHRIIDFTAFRVSILKPKAEGVITAWNLLEHSEAVLIDPKAIPWEQIPSVDEQTIRAILLPYQSSV